MKQTTTYTTVVWKVGPREGTIEDVGVDVRTIPQLLNQVSAKSGVKIPANCEVLGVPPGDPEKASVELEELTTDAKLRAWLAKRTGEIFVLADEEEVATTPGKKKKKAARWADELTDGLAEEFAAGLELSDFLGGG